MISTIAAIAALIVHRMRMGLQRMGLSLGGIMGLGSMTFFSCLILLVTN